MNFPWNIQFINVRTDCFCSSLSLLHSMRWNAIKNIVTNPTSIFTSKRKSEAPFSLPLRGRSQKQPLPPPPFPDPISCGLFHLSHRDLFRIFSLEVLKKITLYDLKRKMNAAECFCFDKIGISVTKTAERWMWKLLHFMFRSFKIHLGQISTTKWRRRWFHLRIISRNLL